MLTAGIPGRLNSQQLGYVEHILAGGGLLLRVIDDVLDLARIDAGKLQLRDEEGIDLGRIAEACIALVREQANAGGLRLSLEFEDRMPLLIVDPGRLTQILLNLLSNAVKFTDSGGSVILAIRHAKNGGVALEVRDTGLGMSAAEIEVALEPFGQVDGSLARRRAHLAVVRVRRPRQRPHLPALPPPANRGGTGHRGDERRARPGPGRWSTRSTWPTGTS